MINTELQWFKYMEKRPYRSEMEYSKVYEYYRGDRKQFSE